MKFKDDNKVMAMSHLLDGLKYSKYPVAAVMKVLSVLDKKGIPFLLDELPEGQTYEFYAQKLDDYLGNILSKK